MKKKLKRGFAGRRAKAEVKKTEAVTKEQDSENVNQQNELIDNDNKPSVNINWKKVKIAVIMLIAAIVIGGIVFALNFKKMQINKANKLIEQNSIFGSSKKHWKSIKEDDDVKNL